MSTLADLLPAQLGLLLLLPALGCGPASLLPERTPALARLALAPAFGLALGAVALLDAALLMPASRAAWVVLLPLAAASAVFAVHRSRSVPVSWRPPRTEAVLLAVAVVAVAGALDASLVAKRSIGPMGYTISDAGYLVAQHDALQDQRLPGMQAHAPSTAPAAFRRALTRPNAVVSLTAEETAQAGKDIGRQFKYIPAGLPSVAAALDSVFGWHAVDTQTAFLVILVLVSALGALGLTRLLTESAWAGLLAAALIAGPVAYQLFIESGEASLSGMTTIAPLAAVGVLLLREGARPALVFLLALLLAGLGALYGLWLPVIAISTLLAVAVTAAARARRARPPRQALRRGLIVIAVSAALVVALCPLAFVRNVNYWQVVAGTRLIHWEVLLGTPAYLMRADVIPGWLLQTRDLYSLAAPHLSDLRGLARGFLLPLVLIALMAHALWRFRGRGALLLLAPLPVAAAFAFRVASSDDCSYCVQRQLILLDPLAVTLIAAGFAALPSLAGSRFLRAMPRESLPAAAALAAIVFAGLVAQKSVGVARHLVDDGYALPDSIRSFEGRLSGSGPVQIEAGGATVGAGLELPVTYYFAQQASGSRPSLQRGSDDFLAVIEFSRHPVPIGPRRDYRLVLTRLKSIHTPRRTLATSGPYALQRRSRPFDASIVSGVSTESPDDDPAGLAWVDGPLRFAVGAADRGPSWLRLALRGPGAPRVRTGGGARIAGRSASETSICAPVPGRGASRHARVPVMIAAQGGPIPLGELRLDRMAASGRRC